MTIATRETQAQIWMILVSVTLCSVAWALALTFFRIFLCASLGQGIESLGIKVNISTFKDRRILKRPRYSLTRWHSRDLRGYHDKPQYV